ncbi:transposase [Caballeronia sp.]|uniref:transposase n=1 Tax=Caballeronia sp. TaxID=1931223 RepID=UPI003C34E1B9
MERPHARTHYPQSLREFQAWFPTDTDCLEYLQWLRWPCGFACPSCGHPEWMAASGRPVHVYWMR